MDIHNNLALLSKEASVTLLADLLKDSEEEKKELLIGLREIATTNIFLISGYDMQQIARKAIANAEAK